MPLPIHDVHGIIDKRQTPQTERFVPPALPEALAWVTTFRPPWYAVVRKSYDVLMALPDRRPVDVSVRQFVADSGAVTRGLRQGRCYTLTLNGEPLARMIPIRRRQAVPKEEMLAIFATAPVVDIAELRADLDETVSQELDDPYGGTGL